MVFYTTSLRGILLIITLRHVHVLTHHTVLATIIIVTIISPLHCLSFLSSEVAEIHLQQHILEQYSISKTTLLQDMDPEEEKTTSTDDIASLSLEAQKITNSYSSGLSDLVVPTPTLTFPTTWSSTKSLPQSLTSSLTGKPHSCTITSPTKIRKTETTQPPPQAPLLSPTAVQQDPVTTRSPIVVYAWSPVKSGNKPKQTQVSNLRSMRER